MIDSQTGNFRRTNGKTVMEAMLKTHGKEIEIVYAHNDDMALGAIQVIDEAGLTPGKDIMVVSIDAIKKAVQAVADGRINCTVECNPLFGPKIYDTIDLILKGEPVEKRMYNKDELFDASNAAAALPTRQYGARPFPPPPLLRLNSAVSSDPLLALRGIGKRLPGVIALDQVDFPVRAGEIHALMGENGAGKSTLIKVLTGVHHPDTGQVKLRGTNLSAASPRDAETVGISTVCQEVNLVPSLSVAENIALGRQPGRFGFIN